MRVNNVAAKSVRKKSMGERITTAIRKDWQLYILLMPAIALLFIFCYLPMYGIQIAFRDYKAVFGIMGSQWVGLKHFKIFFDSYYSWRLISNTIFLNLFGLLWGFPIPVILAIMVNQISNSRFKKFTQTAIYTPHFISPVVMAGMLYLFLSPNTGLFNKLIESLGGTPIFFMIEPGWFRTLFIGSDIWQHAGWNTILYIATLTSIDPGLYEAATMDGATKRQKIWYIDIPHLVPIAIMMLILNCGSLLVSNTDKALLLQTSGNLAVSDIIGVYVFNNGIGKAQFSYATAIGLFTNVVNFVTIMFVNSVSKRLGDTSLF